MPDNADRDQQAGAQATVQCVSAIAEIDRDVWRCLAGADNPFIAYDFLHALEKSKSAAPENGWAPRHIIVSLNKEPVAAAPLYIKGHSQGEYIFDHHWADAYERAGGQYYPKLLCAAPFTPASGPRLLAPTPAAKRIAADAIRSVAAQYAASSAHVNFVLADDEAALSAAGFLIRQGTQYHWFNRGYETFDDFLASLSSRKRKAIRRERRDAARGGHGDGLVISRFQGKEITERHWDAFWTFYQDTSARKWGMPYLTRTFFHLIAETMSDRLLFICAERDGVPIAGALNFIGASTLYGRYWGCKEHHPFLHFEICYHQAIEFAIERGLSRVEAGAQGEHKIARGYEPVATRSAHWIKDPGFKEAIADYLERERRHGEAEIEMLSQYTPFRKS